MIDSVRLQFDDISHVTTNFHIFLDNKWGTQYYKIHTYIVHNKHNIYLILIKLIIDVAIFGDNVLLINNDYKIIIKKNFILVIKLKQ